MIVGPKNFKLHFFSLHKTLRQNRVHTKIKLCIKMSAVIPENVSWLFQAVFDVTFQFHRGPGHNMLFLLSIHWDRWNYNQTELDICKVDQLNDFCCTDNSQLESQLEDVLHFFFFSFNTLAKANKGYGGLKGWPKDRTNYLDLAN